MIYRDALSAVVRALAADCIDSTAKQAWQRQYQSGWPESRSGSGLSPREMMDMDCMVHARLHRELTAGHWAVLVAKYSTHKARKIEAIHYLSQVIVSPAPALFCDRAVTAWAIPQLKGADGKRSSDMLVLPAGWYDMNNWDNEASPERTRQRWRADIRKGLEGAVTAALNCADQILANEGVLVNREACA